MIDRKTLREIYGKLLALYPQEFREQLGASMEKTFQDLYNEKQQRKKEIFAFVFWTFVETATGIVSEYMLLISPGDIMRTTLKAVGSSAFFNLLPILPFMIMEVVNRQNFDEDFPFMLFFVLWLNLFFISLILLPIVRRRRTSNHDLVNSISTQEYTLLTNPRSAAIISIIVFLSPGILFLLDSIGWLSLDRLFNGPNPEVAYLPGQIISLSLILFPVAAGIIACRPIVHTLRAGGSLFAHPLHLIIVLIISFLFAAGFLGLIVDQRPCFMGVPNCD